MLYGLQLGSLIFAALALVPAGAHFFEMFSKLKLDRAGYLAAQRAYDGWNLFGIVVVGALVFTLVLTVMLYRAGQPWILAGLAFLCIAGTQVIFWSFTFPMNAATSNWTVLPESWEALRRQWEYSHACSAALNALALVLLFVSVLNAQED